MPRDGLVTLPPTSADLWLARQTARVATAKLERAAQVVTLAADEKLLLGVVGLAWLGVRLLTENASTRGRANHLALVTAASAALPHLLKQLVDQERPDRCVVGEPRHGVPRSGKPRNAFPSGHAVHLGAIAAALTRWVAAPWGLAIWAVALGVSATRLVLLAHWLTDVGAGLAIGVGLEATLHRLRGSKAANPCRMAGARLHSLVGQPEAETSLQPGWANGGLDNAIAAAIETPGVIGVIKVTFGWNGPIHASVRARCLPRNCLPSRGHGAVGRIAALAIARTDWSHHDKPFFQAPQYREAAAGLEAGVEQALRTRIGDQRGAPPRQRRSAACWRWPPRSA